jgi:hypothetical protein
MLLKWVEVARTASSNAGDEGHPERDVDAEVARIASKTVAGTKGPAFANTVAGLSAEGTDRVEEPGCELNVRVLCYGVVGRYVQEVEVCNSANFELNSCNLHVSPSLHRLHNQIARSSVLDLKMW